MHRTLRFASGAISLVFGVFFAYEAGVAGGLFVRRPPVEVSR
jgi:hypothetical protein